MKKRKVPLRRCTGCYEMKNKKELIRVVKSVEKENGKENENEKFQLDFTGKKSGRGAYICPSLDCFEKVYKKRGLDRSFGQTVPSEVYEQLRKELEAIGES